jgi:formylglycine-generating enzyme required for sulfatase activity
MRLLRKNEQGHGEYLWAKDSSVMIRIPAGVFRMGWPDSLGVEEPDQHPLHEVCLAEFYVDKYEVTNRQYRRFCDATGHPYPRQDSELRGMPDYLLSYPDYPVGNVSWQDANDYCAWAGKELPSEAQWEKAAKGLTLRWYPWGNKVPTTGDLANLPDQRMASVYPGSFLDFDDGYASASPVGTFPAGASPYGVTDMEGNVSEWCRDWYANDYYQTSPDSDPPGPSVGVYRVIRGSSFYDIYFPRPLCASRFALPPYVRHATTGFRCVVSSHKGK